MYETGDTIVAVSSPSSDKRVIIRISGPETFVLLKDMFSPPVETQRGLIQGRIRIDDQLQLEAKLYLFEACCSYTAESLGEIHIDTSSAVVETLIRQILSRGLRMAGPGEFTARRYLNGKMDLTQAEAVNEIITCSNKYQLHAAEKLLAGRLGRRTTEIRTAVMECLSLLEAGLDFSEQDVEFVDRDELVDRVAVIKSELEQLLEASSGYESAVALPTVGIAGAANAGKSSLLNKLLDSERSIVCDQQRTTRDVLSGLLETEDGRYVVFDCAGLAEQPRGVLDRLAQETAIKALQTSTIVLFCVDIVKADWSEDVAIRKLVNADVIIAVATKADLVSQKQIVSRLKKLNELFAAEFLAVSVRNKVGLGQLQGAIDKKMMKLNGTCAVSESVSGLTERHRRAIADAGENIEQAGGELKSGNDEVAAMLLRAGYQRLSGIEHEHIDEQVLENIFSQFCIGK